MRRPSSLVAALVLTLASAVGAQDKAPQQSGGGAAPSEGAAAPAASGDQGAASDKSDDKAKPPGVTGGYSWSDKPAKKGKHHYRRAKRIKVDPNAPIATYPGFRMLPDGSSQLWVQVNRKVPVTANTAGTMASFVLVGAQVTIKNNTRWLLTEYFDTPLARARLRREPAGAQLVLELRENVVPKYRTVDGPGGTMLLYVDLPKAQRSYAATADSLAPGRRAIREPRTLHTPKRSSRSSSRSRRGPNP